MTPAMLSAPTHEGIVTTLCEHLADVFGVPPGEIDVERPMTDLGVGSLETVEAIAGASRALRIRVPMADLTASMNLVDLADLLLLHHEIARSAPPTERPDPALDDERAAVLARIKASQRRRAAYDHLTYDMFIGSASAEHGEIEHFNRWIDDIMADGRYAFESTHLEAQRPIVRVQRPDGEAFELINLSCYNYLGYSHHPEVIAAAKAALDTFGLGATSSPIASGTLAVHRQLEDELVDFFGLPDHGASLFSSGYAVNVGVISAFMTPGSYVVCDRAAHMSILEGAQLSRAHVRYFDHGDLAGLEAALAPIAGEGQRILVCIEGVYSADGDYGRVAETVAIARRHGARVLVDEAHSMLLDGPGGRGVSAAQGVLADVDLLVLTFSKAFAGVGGALVARRPIVRYVNWYARCRMFSCAMDPAVTGGILQALRLARSPDGDARRARLHHNAAYVRDRLRGRVDLGQSTSWIIPVIFGAERLSIAVSDALQRKGLDAGILTFPAASRGEARIRLFITSEHSRAELDRAVEIILETARELGFARGEEASP
ncbi:MAG: aminotransferase class I/II-fold pyridoxal phosphate-dependent enzyme [bacterium]